jgi:flagellar protein FlgJ
MQYFGDMLNEQYADAIVESGSTGLAQQLYESMKTNYTL